MQGDTHQDKRFSLLEQNPIALGCWALGGKLWGGQSERDSMEVMEEALKRGIDHFDTAQGYGVSEELVGKFIEDKRSQIFLASKVYPRAGGAQVREVLQRSLDRLRTDYIDVYYLHWPVEGGDLTEQLEALAEAREAGLIGAIGVSNYSLEQLKFAESIVPVEFYQGGYHLFWRALEADILPHCLERGIRFVSYSSLGQGILTGKFPEKPQFPKGDHRAGHVLHFREDVWPHVYHAVERLKKLAVDEGPSLGQMAIQWSVSQPAVSSVLVGARKAQQVAENANALNRPIPESTLREMRQISDDLHRHLPKADHIFDA